MNQESQNPHPTVGHVVPLKVLIGVILALLVLTWVTVFVADPAFDLGRTGNVVLALGIALAKAGLVAMYFMHLRYDKPLNGLFLLTGLLFVVIFLGITISDVSEYQPDLREAQEARQAAP